MLWSIMQTLFKMFVSVLGFIFNVWKSVQAKYKIWASEQPQCGVLCPYVFSNMVNSDRYLSLLNIKFLPEFHNHSLDMDNV